jgi:lysophospholipid acyltransferase (LPLAT)-like uncharacterized protein
VKLISLLASLFIRSLHATLRVQHIHPEYLESTPQSIVTFWHCHLLLMLHSRFHKPISVLSSKSRDGEYIAGVFRYYGVDCVRGSSSSGGGAAIRALLRRTRVGNSLVFTPDGPRGPARVAKAGVIFAAQSSGLPIVPVAFAAKKKSFSRPGTGWSCRIRSARRSTSMVRPSSCRVTAMSKSGA